MKVTKDIGKWAIRLEGLPWKWIRADRLGLSPAKLRAFVALSKDAPDVLALAIEDRNNYKFVNADFYNVWTYPRQLRIEGRLLGMSRIYVPLGFALDVEGWMGQWPNQMPEGRWVDFCDLTRTMDEGGDADRYFAAHYVGPSWWVVPMPS